MPYDVELRITIKQTPLLREQTPVILTIFECPGEGPWADNKSSASIKIANSLVVWVSRILKHRRRQFGDW